MWRSSLSGRLSSLNQQLRRRYHSMSKAAIGQKPLLSIKPNQLENLNRSLHYNEKKALLYGLWVVVIAGIALRRLGPDEAWYMDKLIAFKLKLYNLFAKEKIEIVEDFEFKELKLEDRPREQPYVKKRDGITEVESY